MTGLRKRIKQAATTMAGDILVKDVRIGLGYTAVCLDGRRIGLAYTFHEQAGGGCNVFGDRRSLAGRPAAEFIDLVDAENPIAAAVGLAACNALGNTADKDYSDGDIISQLNIQPTDRVCMVGNFGPVAPMIRKACKELLIFERIDEAQGNLLPVRDMPQYLPDSQVAVITSTSIINNTVDDILQLAAPCREVVMLGASTPLMPEVFSDSPVTLLSGVLANDPAEVLRVVSEGGGMVRFKSHVRKVNLVL